ncbi:MAG: DNA polymerase IV [Candidatus Methanofastidiosum methylothiophilum]|uniref:DNA polymerase IV n=1 Tax=Candidatus Methanofastidiosum methylothiophilum TaxID=1705564 RepID=A0A150IMS9_9EURY|nr:MAG: DNA polymerase IV [Candidatus Methanofastidiosum methylthiophilus]KYC48117.1 MAG: DNA polymerase IV [Candidatus Methanofastidiosum methylthiophilus]KYC50644.1 MAG: DNA polymerase IV [Candidatus Methanofastidiosum methylthiophilus]
MARIILHVDLDSFYASVEENRDNKIRGKPIVICVYSGRNDNSGAVSTSNYKARELGIKAGMPIILAKRIAKGKDVVFLPVDMEYYREVSERIMDLLEEESNIIEQVSIDEAYLDVTKSSEGNWDKAIQIANKIKDKIKSQENLTVSIGIASNKFVAKMASDFQKPNGLTLVKEEEKIRFLQNLKVSKLHGIGEKTTKLLSEIGIETARDLSLYELKELEEVFGKNKAKLLHDKSLGIDDSPVEPREKKQLSRIGTLKDDTNDKDIIYQKLLELSKDMDQRIIKNNVSFRTVSLITIDTELKTQTKSETIPQTKDIQKVISISKRLLEDYLEENPDKKLRRVGIRISNLEFSRSQKTLDEF